MNTTIFNEIFAELKDQIKPMLKMNLEQFIIPAAEKAAAKTETSIDDTVVSAIKLLSGKLLD